jgi:hypothetical protein
MRVCQFRHFGTKGYRRDINDSPNVYSTGWNAGVKLWR